MTTEATQGQQSAIPPEMDTSDVREVYRILGGLERGQEEIKERFDRQDQRFDRQDERFERQEERNEQRFRDVTRRIDRLWYSMVGIGAALAVGYILDRVLAGG